MFLISCIGLQVEGIYRLSASQGDINRLKMALNNGKIITTYVYLSVYSTVHVHFMCVMTISLHCKGSLFLYMYPNPGPAAVDIYHADWSDVNVFAGALKLYLRELPDPVFTYQLYPDFIQAGR